MKHLESALFFLLLISVCGCKPQFMQISVYNNLDNEMVKVEFSYDKEVVSKDKTVRYTDSYLMYPLKQFPKYDLMYYDFPELSGRATIRKPVDVSEIEFKQKTITYMVRPQFIAYLKVERKNFNEILEMINQITISSGNDTIIYSAQDSLKLILKESRDYYGVTLQVDSAMFRNYRDL